MSEGDQGIAEFLHRPQAGYFHHGEIRAGHPQGRTELPLPQFRATLQRKALPAPHLLSVPYQDHKGTLPAAKQLEHALPWFSGAERNQGQGNGGAFHGSCGTV